MSIISTVVWKLMPGEKKLKNSASVDWLSEKDAKYSTDTILALSRTLLRLATTFV